MYNLEEKLIEWLRRSELHRLSSAYEADEISVSPLRCPLCGKYGYRTIPVASHYETECCHQVVASCCEGPVSFLP